MEDQALRHLAAIYGLDPDMPHAALRFPRLPPGPAGPLAAFRPGAAGELGRRAEAGGALRGFQEAYRARAMALLGEGSPVAPPGHPLLPGGGSAAALRAERDRLRKENAELRRRLGDRAGDPGKP